MILFTLTEDVTTISSPSESEEVTLESQRAVEAGPGLGAASSVGVRSMSVTS